ncbi:normal mucosa of esophagus-specific gene 1 protein-like [Oratosquilla oratoria]|uniref:normal mucosa of esophagus-specific gene 1 protein-like n=1 Tax=Oratosquilla oratoria TaxID=337810 RepID=UPI003F76A99E
MSYHKGAPSRAFGLKAFKAFPEVFPLCAIMGVAIVGVSTWCLYALGKTDVVINRRKLEPWNRVDVNTPQKILTFNQKYYEDPEITALKEEIAQAYKPK